METIITWFKQLDWLANALAVMAPVGGLTLFIWKWSKAKSKSPKFFTDLLKPVQPGTFKKIGQIAIVDDNISDFPVSELKRAGYNIKTYRHVSVSDFDEISRFDVVFLDMFDIVKDDPTEGGLKLIHTLRSKSPRQKICAVSSNTFNPSATAFFKQADDAQNKPISAQKCVQVMDSFLLEKLEPTTLAKALDSNPEIRSAEKASLLLQLADAASNKKALTADQLPDELNPIARSIAVDLARVLAA